MGDVLSALKPRLDGRTRLLLGHSLGGQAALLHLALHGSAAVDGLALIAVGVPHWRSYPGARGLGVLPYTQGIAATAALLGVWPGWGFGGRQARGVIRDWAYTARTGRFPGSTVRTPRRRYARCGRRCWRSAWTTTSTRRTPRWTTSAESSPERR
ncbi:hypothetical protein GCM10027614_72910 [Micromonospora vulcania]